MEYFLRVRVNTPVGEFEGKLNQRAGERRDCEALRDTLQKTINDLDYVVVFTDHNDTEITFPKEVIKNSVFTFRLAVV